jgi:hypothetical protein
MWCKNTQFPDNKKGMSFRARPFVAIPVTTSPVMRISRKYGIKNGQKGQNNGHTCRKEALYAFSQQVWPII